MKKIKITPVLVAFLASLALIFTGCEEQGPMEDTGEEMDDTMEEAGDEMEDATN